MTDTQKPLMTFPCEFHVKAFGNDTPEFETSVMDIMRRHVPDLADNAVSKRPSKDGKYVALNISFTAKSKDQLDAIYQELSTNPLVLMAL